jgi:dCMP deaminase
LRNQVGGVLVRDYRIIATGFNGAPHGIDHCTGLDSCPVIVNGRETCKRALHCEEAIISFCAREGISTNDSDLFITLCPCYDCAQIIINAKIKKVSYIEEYTGTNGLDLLAQAGIETEKVEENPDLRREL